MGYKVCECVGCYADDTIFTCSDEDPDRLSQKLSEKYSLLSDFLVSNKLKLNDDKTHLMVMTTSRRRVSRLQGSQVEISTPTETVESSKCEMLLGGLLHQDMKWGEHILDNEASLVRSLNSRLGALKMVSKVASFKNRKMIANGIFMSKLTYLMSLWGGYRKDLIQKLQSLQNKAARAVTKLDWYTPTSELLKQCGWLSVQQLIAYHSLILVYKVMQAKSPKYLYSMFSTPYNYKTRQAQCGIIRQDRGLDLDLAADSFRWRASELYNQLPLVIRNMDTLEKFKTRVKDWIKKNVQLR